MNLSTFLEHWAIRENPFDAQEARHDRIFARLPIDHTSHPDFEKILGDLANPSSAIVFGEKGSGKTAIRLQLAQRVEEHNRHHPDAKVWLVAYDDLGPVLDWFAGHAGITGDSAPAEILTVLQRVRLVDHIDGLLHAAVPPLVDGVLGRTDGRGQPLGEHPERSLRQAGPELKRDLQVLQALYDRDGATGERALALRRRIGARIEWRRLGARLLALFGWLLPAACLAQILWKDLSVSWSEPWTWALVTGLGVWLYFVLAQGLEKFRVRRLAQRLGKELRTPQRTRESLTATLGALPAEAREASFLPVDDLEEGRYAMLQRLKRVLGRLGFRSVLVVVDRVDEPTLINADPERMRALIWPMMRNKFLQQDGLGLKLLLPLELRGELFRESSEFYQEARMDKQNMVEQLSWSGAMLYDLCNARLRACRNGDDGSSLSLVDLFDDDVSRQDVVDALEAMHQPRDAFKLIYDCMLTHCSSFTEDQPHWRIPRLVLESVRKQQTNRLQMFHKGFRPA